MRNPAPIVLALLLALALILIATPAATAQTVSTFATGFVTNGDLAVDAAGNVYVSCENADSVIRRITPDSTVTVFADNLSLSRGLAFDASGDTLYVARTNLLGAIRKVAPDGSKTTFVNGFGSPTGIAFGPSGNLYVTDNSAVTKVLPDGTKVTLTSDPVLNRPHGIAVDDQENIYVASAHDGNLYRIDSSHLHGSVNLEWFAHVDGLQQQWACGFMTHHQGSLYITNGDNKVHRIGTTDGIVTDYAGSGVGGWQDGTATEARFQAPNGIAATPDGRIWVAGYGVGRIRVVEPPVTSVGAAPLSAGPGLRLEAVRPNPFVRGTTLALHLPATGPVRVSVFDAAGRHVRTLLDGTRPAGRLVTRWDGTTDDGRTAAAGVYLYRVDAAGESAGGKVVRTR